MSWTADLSWSDRYKAAICSAIAPHLIHTAPLEEDRSHNTDLIVWRSSDLRIACRIRRPGWFEKDPFDITIRTSRPSGRETEYAKIVAGWGDWFFYGHADRTAATLRAWWLCDLAVLRRQIADKPNRYRKLKNNVDGSSDFEVLSVIDLPPNFVITSFGVRRPHIPGDRPI